MAGTIQQRGIGQAAYAASGGVHAASGLVARGRDAYAGFDVTTSMRQPAMQARASDGQNPQQRAP
jgi:hypothetical protein